MSEQEVEDLILFGKNAKRILEDPIFIQVMQTVRDDIHLSWSQTNPSDSEDREQYYNLLKSMDLLEEKLFFCSLISKSNLFLCNDLRYE